MKQFLSILTNKLRLPAWIIGIEVLLATLPLFNSGFFSLHDEAQHIVDIYEMNRAFEVGGFPPRWAPDLTFGLGYPYFNFYYHLPFYISTFFMHLGFSMTQSFKAVIFLSLIFGPIGFFLLARRHVSQLAALIAASLYLYTPYFAVDSYVRGALGELVLLSLLPWAALGINHLITKPSILSFIFSSVVIGMLGISHNVLNIFVFPFLFVYGLALIFFLKNDSVRKSLLVLIAAFLAGALLSSYYWLPPFFEMRFISKYEQIKIEDQFPFLKQLLIPSWGYGGSHWGPNDEMSFQIGTFNLLAVVLSVFVFKFIDKKLRKYVLFFLAVFAVFFGLMNYRTLPFWNLHPFLRYIQFPWRLLIFTTFSTAFLAALVAEGLLSRVDNKRGVVYTTIAILAIVLFNVWYFRPNGYKEVADERYLEMYFANRTLKGNGERGYLSRDYLGFSEDFLPPTIWQKKRPEDISSSFVQAKRRATLSYLQNGIRYLIDVDSPQDNQLLIYATYFPGWTAYIDGKKMDTFPATDLGIIGLDIPSGKHAITVQFEDTPIRATSNLLSLGTLFFLGVILVRKIFIREIND